MFTLTQPQPQSQSQSQHQNDILKYVHIQFYPHLPLQDHTFNTQFTQTGQRPQNFIKNVSPYVRYNKYPRLAQLMQQKSLIIKKRNHPPVFIKTNLQQFQLTQNKLGGKFDVILIDPPWEEYQKRAKRINKYQQKQSMIIIIIQIAWTMDKLSKLKISQIGQTPSFIFLWVGSQHLQDGRQLLKTWNYKRCQDIVWVKTNTIRHTTPPQSQQGIFTRVKQHCLMGYKGQPKKASSHFLIHPNIDIDVIITEQPEIASLQKPTEIYDIIQRFCLGRKKIELFGNVNNIRNGWLTIGNMLKQTIFDVVEYNKWFKEDQNKQKQKDKQYNSFIGGRYVGTNPTIESLRPKEDVQNDKSQQQQQNSSTKLSESNLDDVGKRSLAKSDTSRN